MRPRIRGGRRFPAIFVVLAFASWVPTAGDTQAADAVLTLKTAIERALTASPRLGIAEAEVAAAKGTERQAELLPNPEFTFEAENVGGSGPYRRLDSAELTYGLTQSIEVSGKRGARRAGATAERMSAELTAKAARLDLIRDVTVAYTGAVAADQSLSLATDLEAVAKDVLKTVTNRVSAARDPMIQKNKAEVAYTTSTIGRARAARTRDTARQVLARLWGEPLYDGALDRRNFFTLTPPPPLETYQALLAGAPDVLRLHHLENARQADLKRARAARIPDPKVTIGVRQFRDSNEQAFVAGISIPIPVFDQNQGEIARAGAEVLRAENASLQAERDRAQALVDAWWSWQTAWLEATSLKERLLPQAENAFRLSLDGYRIGRFPYLDVLDAQRTLFEVRTEHVAALVRLHTARAEVERLSGLPRAVSTE
jgi:cobalt-zinc-cadmium efflux system outer membrane protein